MKELEDIGEKIKRLDSIKDAKKVKRLIDIRDRIRDEIMPRKIRKEIKNEGYNNKGSY